MYLFIYFCNGQGFTQQSHNFFCYFLKKFCDNYAVFHKDLE